MLESGWRMFQSARASGSPIRSENPIHENAAITIHVQMDIVTYLLKRQLSSASGVIGNDAEGVRGLPRNTQDTLCLAHSNSGMTRVGHFRTPAI